MPSCCLPTQDLLLLALLLLRTAAAALAPHPQAATDSPSCRLQRQTNASSQPGNPQAVCSSNATRIDLSAQGLSGQLTLDFGSQQQLHIALLNVSGNPGLTGVAFAGRGPFASVHIASLDVSGTAMAPVPGRLLNVSTGLLSLDTLLANGTAYAEPLDLGQATDLLYRMRVQAFSLVNWRLASDSLPANLTSHSANRCGTKYFKSLAVSRSRQLRAIDGGNGGVAMTVTDAIDLSGNGLRSVSNVAFSAGRVDLSDNQLAELPGVAFHPGSFCRAAVTGPPTLLLRRNRLVYAALDSLAAGSRQSGGFTGLDLSGNERLVPEEAGTITGLRKVAPNETIAVSEFLDLSGLGGHASGMAALLARFRLSASARGSAGPAAAAAFRLSLADNWLPDLFSAAALVADFVAKGGSDNNSAAPLLLHLDLSGNPLLAHLNLSDIQPRLLESLTIKRLPHLRSVSVFVRGSHEVVLERLRRRDRPPDAAFLAELWSRRVPLRLDAQPDRCCLSSENSELVCTFGSVVRRGNSASDSVYCYANSEEEPQAQLTPPELPLMFTCIVLGCALLLGLVTGVAVFYARRRYSRGRYAVYSIYAVHVKDSHQSQHSSSFYHQHPQLTCHVELPPSSSPGNRVQLKTATVCRSALRSCVLPIEKAATPV